MGAKSYYDILNIPRNANEKEIKQAYRTLTKKYHPDVCKEEGAEERFKEINEAYGVLSDSQKRAQYDSMGHDAFSSASKGSYSGPGGFGGGQGGFYTDFSGFGDIFDAFFGGGGRQRSPQRGTDQLLRMQVTLKEAVLGAEREIELNHTEACPTCGGTGSATGKLNTCPQCGGSGQERRMSQTPLGQFVRMTTCSRCQGRGKIAEQPCKECRGSGHVQVKRSVTVHIPPGADNGMRLRMEGYGEAGEYGASNGDLFIEMVVQPDARFTRRGDNLESTVTITPAQAVLGCKIGIETIDDRQVELKVPAGVQYNTALKITGEGVRRRGRPGDLLIRVQIAIPKRLSEHERELWEQLAELNGGKAGADQKKGFFKDFVDRVKDTGR